jgi:hypothetical protein
MACLRGLLLGMLALAAPSLAQTCPARDGALERSDAARLKFLSDELLAESHRARNWSLAWGATYAVLTVGQVAVVPLIIKQDQVEWWVGAATSAVGLGFTIMDPLEVRTAGPGYAARAAVSGSDCALIAEGEGLLERSAIHETASRRWYIHAANVGINLGIGLILGVGYDHWVAAAVNFAIGAAFGELTIFTSPTRLISAWSEYQRGELSAQPVPISVRLFPMFHPGGAGVGVALAF